MKYTIGMLWFLSIAAAFYVGQKSQVDPGLSRDSSIVELENSSGLQITKKTNPQVANKESSKPNGQKLNAAPQSEKTVDLDKTLETIKTLLADGSGSNLSQLLKAYSLIESLTQEQLIAALNQLNLGSEDTNPQLLSLFLNRYAEIEPIDAMAFVEQTIMSEQSKMIASSTVLGIWAQSDPLSALDWFHNNASLGNNASNGAGLISIFNGLANQDLGLAFDSLRPFLNDRRMSNMAMIGLTNSLSVSDDFYLALDKTKGMDNKNLTKTIVRAWVRKNPDQAIDWLHTIEDDKELTEMEESIYGAWIQTDTDKAAESYLNSADSTNRQSRAKFVVDRLSYSNPEKAYTWLHEQSEIDSAPLVKHLVKRSTYSNPTFAAKHLDVFTDKKDYLSNATSIYLAFERNSQTQADDFLTGASYKNELETKISERKVRMEKYQKNN